MAFLDCSRLGPPLTTTDTNEVRYNCVFCDDEGYHCYVNLRKRVFHCFKCGQKGKTNLVSKEIELTHYVSLLKKERPKQINPFKLPSAYTDIITPAAQRYLLERGIKESDVERHRIYCAAPNTMYFGRIIIPNNPFRGYCNYFVARAYTNIRFPKYLNPLGDRNSLFLSPSEHSQYYEQHWGSDTLMLVEGPFDYLKASRHGPTAALLGKQLSNAFAREIVTEFSHVYVMLDQGLAEDIAALKIAEMLRPHINVDVLQCPKKDPGEMSPEDFADLL